VCVSTVTCDNTPNLQLHLDCSENADVSASRDAAALALYLLSWSISQAKLRQSYSPCAHDLGLPDGQRIGQLPESALEITA
jgi:hypothetical protein